MVHIYAEYSSTLCNWRSNVVCWWLFIWGIREEGTQHDSEILWNSKFRIWNMFFFEVAFLTRVHFRVPAPLKSFLLLHLKYFKENPSPFWLHLAIEFPSSTVCMESLFRKVVGQVWEWQLFTPSAILKYPVWVCPEVFENRCGQESPQWNRLMMIYSVPSGFSLKIDAQNSLLKQEIIIPLLSVDAMAQKLPNAAGEHLVDVHSAQEPESGLQCQRT